MMYMIYDISYMFYTHIMSSTSISYLIRRLTFSGFFFRTDPWQLDTLSQGQAAKPNTAAFKQMTPPDRYCALKSLWIGPQSRGDSISIPNSDILNYIQQKKEIVPHCINMVVSVSS